MSTNPLTPADAPDPVPIYMSFVPVPDDWDCSGVPESVEALDALLGMLACQERLDGLSRPSPPTPPILPGDER